MKVLLIGNGAREQALAEALLRSPQKPELFVFAEKLNPVLGRLATQIKIAPSTDLLALQNFAQEFRPDFALIGPEAPIVAGATDALQVIKIPTVAPTKKLAQLESSKSFTRALLEKYNIPGNPNFAVFEQKNFSPKALQSFLENLNGEFVVKADGLAGGKGVKVVGEHLNGITDGTYYANQCLTQDGRVVIEEKLLGEEFSAMFLTDGQTLAPLPLVQDHKRAFEGDQGPNTGGMGSYSLADHTLPFLQPADLAAATKITTQVLAALKQETGTAFKGVLYGGFMATAQGVYLVEYNVRFGDPEALNILPILETDFVAICQAILNGTLKNLTLKFASKATVCKYVVPAGYPNEPQVNSPIKLLGLPLGCQVFHAAVTRDAAGILRTGSSRALAFVGIAADLATAEQLAEIGAQKAEGALYHRRDIGTPDLIERRIAHMQKIRIAK